MAVIGVDLGTTNTCVAVVEGGQPKIIPARTGDKTSPSVVAISETGKRLVGQLAKRQAVANPTQTVSAAKRLIGRRYDSPAVATAREAAAYEIVEGLMGDVRIRIKGEAVAVPEITAMVLAEAKLAAENYLCEDVNEAVITVPAYFNDGQRQATIVAGQIAGLEAVRIINEPTAAALAYGFERDMATTVVVYDLGGGTFDARVVQHLAGCVPEGMKMDPRSAPVALQRLKDAAEKARRELSSAEQAFVDLPFLFKTDDDRLYHMQETITREQLEELTADLVERTIAMCEQTLAAAWLDKTDIDDVLLVGGMTRMPLIRTRVAQCFGRQPSRSVHPDEAVAIGAALQASKLDGEDHDIVLIDVTPHAIGIMLAGGEFHELIPKNTSIPTTATHVFTTVRSNQQSIRIVLVQGSDEGDDEDRLGEFVLGNLREAGRGEVEIEVTFLVSADNVISVAARDVATGREQSVTMVASSGLSGDEIQNLTERQRAHLDDERRAQRGELPARVDDT